MKNIISKSLIVCLSLFMFSCEKTDDPIYEGESYLQFNKAASGVKTVESGQVTADAKIEYGVLNAVSGDHQVNLVYDAAASTAVPGVDFTLVDGGVDQLTSGQTTGEFTVKVLESGASPVPKVAVFHLSSPTLPVAAFGKDYALTMSLKCPVSVFLGATGVFNYSGWWNDPGQYQIIQNPGVANSLRVVDWLDTGLDFVVNYNDEGVVTFPEQSTGINYQTGPNKYTIKMSQSGAVSTYDACSRKLTINAFWFVPNVGSFGEKTEVFVGN